MIFFTFFPYILLLESPNQVLLKFPIFRLKSSKKSSLEQLPHLTQDVNEEPDTWKSVMKPPPDRLVDREKRGRS